MCAQLVCCRVVAIAAKEESRDVGGGSASAMRSCGVAELLLYDSRGEDTLTMVMSASQDLVATKTCRGVSIPCISASSLKARL